MGDVTRASRREKQFVGLIGFLCAAALPAILWHRAIAAVASDFRLDFGYLVTGWTGYALIVLGLMFMLPVAFSAGRNPGSRLYPRFRNAYMGWGVSLYLMGFAVAVEVSAAVG
jgi:hypothetical protein